MASMRRQLSALRWQLPHLLMWELPRWVRFQCDKWIHRMNSVAEDLDPWAEADVTRLRGTTDLLDSVHTEFFCLELRKPCYGAKQDRILLLGVRPTAFRDVAMPHDLFEWYPPLTLADGVSLAQDLNHLACAMMHMRWFESCRNYYLDS